MGERRPHSEVVRAANRFRFAGRAMALTSRLANP